MSGFQSPNYTQTPNDLFDELLPDMGLAELKVVLCIVRHTFGFHREEIKMSIRAIARFTGLTANSVMEGARQAEDHGLIERHLDGNKTTSWTAIVSVVPTKTRRITRRDARVSPTETLLGVKERLNKSKRNKEATPPPPEVILFRSVTDRYPSKDTYEIVVTAIHKVKARLGRDVVKEDLLPFWQAWRTKDYRKTNLSWLVDWAVPGFVPNGKQSPAPSGMSVAQSWLAKKEQEAQRVNA